MIKNENNYIVFDIGNTMIKMFAFDKDLKVIFKEKWLCASNKSIVLENILAFFMPSFDDQIVIGSTNSNIQYQNDIEKQLQSLGFKNISILNNSCKTNLKLNENIQHNELGLDIKACCEWAYQNEIQNAYIFMFGSALVGLKIQEGILEGASIAPGAYASYRHMKSSIPALDMLPYVANKELGTNTQEALNSGLYNLLNGFVLSNIKQNTNCEIVLTGGDGAYLKNHYTYKEELVALGYLYLVLNTSKPTTI
ncbi:type III pantothenate kinase [Mycoplasma sp. VS31B]